MATDHPLFVYRYMDRSFVRKDSARFRRRLAAGFKVQSHQARYVTDMMILQAGIAVHRHHEDNSPQWWDFFERAAIEDVLTTITIAIQAGRQHGFSSWADTYRDFVDSVFRDEHLGFRIDEAGVIHYAVDEDFESTRLATIAALDAPALVASRAAYEHAFGYMDRHPADTKGALRSAFEAVEIVSRQLCPAHRNLHAKLCKGELKQRCLEVNSGDAVEKRVLGGIFDSMAEWVTAMHTYRHGQPDNFERPTEDFTVFCLTTASAYLRLLAQVAVKVDVQPWP